MNRSQATTARKWQLSLEQKLGGTSGNTLAPTALAFEAIFCEPSVTCAVVVEGAVLHEHEAALAEAAARHEAELAALRNEHALSSESRERDTVANRQYRLKILV